MCVVVLRGRRKEIYAGIYIIHLSGFMCCAVVQEELTVNSSHHIT